MSEIPARVCSFGCVELLGLDPVQAQARLEGALQKVGKYPSTDRFRAGIAPHAAYSGSTDLLRATIEYQTLRGLPVTIHAAESREEAELFASTSGPLQAFCKRIFPTAPEHRGLSPVRWLESQGLLPDGLILVHGNTLDDTDMEILARRKATVVHCPSSHAFFGHPRFPHEKLRAHGIPVCLGTDSLASGDSLSMLEQMRLFAANYLDIPYADIVAMATSTAAQTLGMTGVGVLKAGYKADFIAVNESGGLEEIRIAGEKAR
jgi:cytosine/adenosine deaminase-related metal-dependent hydrolase